LGRPCRALDSKGKAAVQLESGLEHRARAGMNGRMKELVQKLVAQADLSEAQAQKVADVVRGFLAEKLPESVRGYVDAALTGQKVEAVADKARDLLGGFLK